MDDKLMEKIEHDLQLAINQIFSYAVKGDVKCNDLSRHTMENLIKSLAGIMATIIKYQNWRKE